MKIFPMSCESHLRLLIGMVAIICALVTAQTCTHGDPTRASANWTAAWNRTTCCLRNPTKDQCESVTAEQCGKELNISNISCKYCPGPVPGMPKGGPLGDNNTCVATDVTCDETFTTIYGQPFTVHFSAGKCPVAHAGGPPPSPPSPPSPTPPSLTYGCIYPAFQCVPVPQGTPYSGSLSSCETICKK